LSADASHFASYAIFITLAITATALQPAAAAYASAAAALRHAASYG
jgi:hypothetical protein